MGKGKLVIIAIQDEYLSIITKQIVEILGNEIEIRSVTVKDLTMEMISPDEAVLLSVNTINPLVKSILPQGIHCFIAKRGINFINIKRLLDVPAGRNILVINDTKDNTEEAIKELKESVFEHNYYPYYPNDQIPDFIDFVVTPGETHLIPKGIPNVIDIGSRVIDIETVIELCKYFKIQYKDSLLLKRYMKSLVSLSNRDSYIEDNKEDIVVPSDNRVNRVKFKFDDIVTESKAMSEFVYMAKKISLTDKPVFIIGKTGSGKSMISQAIHNESNFKNGPFISVNCAERSMDSLEKELFGTEKEQQYVPGLLELAEGGSLCIKEIGEMSLELQAKLLRVLEEKKIVRSQERKFVDINARIIITSSIDISSLVNKGLFIKELFYLISIFSLKVPSLEQRKEDFEPLVRLCLCKYLNCSDMMIADDVMEMLKKYSWDGNVRELFNVISAMASLNEKVITEKCVPYYVKIMNEANNRILVDDVEIDEKKIIETLENRGFLRISIAILEIFQEGKRRNTSYGRTIVKKLLESKGFVITDQQLRLRLQILDELDLLITRQGRLGTTISRGGEKFLEKILN